MAVWAEFNGLNCHSCSKHLKAARGCETDQAENEIEGYKITRCPLTFVDTAARYYLHAYAEYKNGFLPCEGSWQGQPAKTIEAIQVIGGIVERLKEKEK